MTFHELAKVLLEKKTGSNVVGDTLGRCFSLKSGKKWFDVTEAMTHAERAGKNWPPNMQTEIMVTELREVLTERFPKVA
jgi:hypothetical protein